MGVGESDQLPLSMSMAFEERYGHGWLLFSPASVSEQGIFLPSSVVVLAALAGSEVSSSVESRGMRGEVDPVLCISFLRRPATGSERGFSETEGGVVGDGSYVV